MCPYVAGPFHRAPVWSFYVTTGLYGGMTMLSTFPSEDEAFNQNSNSFINNTILSIHY